jgi:hypothetical protein
VEQIASVTSLLMQEFQLELFTVASHKQYVRALLRSSKIQLMQPLSQQMLQHVVFTLMESHLLYTLMFHKITKTISTVQAAQHELENQALL